MFMVLILSELLYKIHHQLHLAKCFWKPLGNLYDVLSSSGRARSSVNPPSTSINVSSIYFHVEDAQSLTEYMVKTFWGLLTYFLRNLFLCEWYLSR